jgi:hypothetical protein
MRAPKLEAIALAMAAAVQLCDEFEDEMAHHDCDDGEECSACNLHYHTVAGVRFNAEWLAAVLDGHLPFMCESEVQTVVAFLGDMVEPDDDAAEADVPVYSTKVAVA